MTSKILPVLWGGNTSGTRLTIPPLYQVLHPLQPIELKELQQAVKKYLPSLSDNQRFVLQGRLGITGEKKTLAEIGEVMGCRRETVRLLEVQAVKKIQSQWLKNEEGHKK